MTDAALWYDSAEIIGVYSTPQATRRIKHEFSQKSGSSKILFIDNAVIEYPIPFKDKSSQLLYAVNWPWCIGYLKEEKNKQLDYIREFYSLIYPFTTPPGTESKYSNTEAFVFTALAAGEL